MQQRVKHAGREIGGSMIEPLEGRRLLAAELGKLITFGDQNDINRGYAVALDDDGSMYVAGTFRDEADVAPGEEVVRIRARGDDKYDEAFIVKYAPDRSVLWAFSIGGSIGSDGITQMKLGPDGSVYVGGYFRGTVDFAPGGETFNLTGYGDRDGFIARYTEDGELMWAGHVGSSRDDEVTALAVGPDGDVYYSGSVRLSGDIDPTPRVRSVKARGVDDTFISRLNGSNGRVRWVRQFGEENTREPVNSMVVDDTGLYVAGLFNRTVQFQRGSSRFTLTQRDYDDAYVGRLSLDDGQWDWIGQIGSEDRDTAADIAFGPTGDLYVTGNFGSSADFDFGKGQTVLRSEDEEDAFVARYRNTGTLVWARNFGEADDDGRVRANAIAVDDAGNAYIAGAFHEEVDFDPSGGAFVADADKDDAPSFSEIGSSDAFVLKLDDNGRFVRLSRTGGEDGSAVPYDIAVFNGRMYTTGQFGGSLDFQPGSGTTRRKTDDDGDESDVFLWDLIDN